MDITQDFPSNLLSILFWLLIPYVSPASSKLQSSAEQCRLTMKNYTFEYKYSQDGDILIGGIFTVNSNSVRLPKRNSTSYYHLCFEVSRREYRNLLAFIFAIDEMNRNPDILPNMTLGYHVYDSCGSVNKAIKDVLQILSGHKMTAPNYSCMEHGTVAGFIGDRQSATTLGIAQLLSLYKYVLVSYGARDTLLSDRRLYPNFFRTVQDNQIQYEAIVKLLETFKWNWVGIVTSDDDYGERELQQLGKHLASHGVCIEFKILVSPKNCKKIPPELQTSTTDVILICGTFSRTFLRFLYGSLSRHGNKTFIFTNSQSVGTDIYFTHNCSLVFSPPKFSVPEMETFFRSYSSVLHKDDPLQEDILINYYLCLSRNTFKNLVFSRIKNLRFRNCSIGEYDTINKNVPSEVTSYKVYLAVHMLVQALHDMYISLHTNNGIEDFHMYKHAYKLLEYMRRVYYKDPTNKEIFFNEKGEVPNPLHIENWIIFQMNVTNISVVGLFDGAAPDGQQLNISLQLITWKNKKVPQGRCSEPCPPGTRKALREGYHICCYDCVPCSDGEISVIWDAENCQKCPDDEWPNEAKNKCVPKSQAFLSLHDDVALLFIVSSIIFSVLSVFIIGLFAYFLDTPIVTANNRSLSFVILLCLILSMSSIFLFLGRPVHITCLLRQVIFGMSFTIVLSSVLAKTIMVCIAFKATKPGSVWRKCLGVKLPITVMLLCSSVQVITGIAWLLVSPPFVEYDMNSFSGKTIIQCNEGSVLAFYIMLGYMGLLAAVSFVLAFMVRTLPDIFNEAKYITFSMLVFCSVWIGAIPAYLSSKGKQMVIVEIFAILASSIGILGCIFFPKCYNLLLRPERNDRRHLLHKHSL